MRLIVEKLLWKNLHLFKAKKEPVSMCYTSKGLTGCYVPIDDEEGRQFRTSATLALFAFEYWIGF